MCGIMKWKRWNTQNKISYWVQNWAKYHQWSPFNGYPLSLDLLKILHKCEYQLVLNLEIPYTKPRKRFCLLLERKPLSKNIGLILKNAMFLWWVLNVFVCNEELTYLGRKWTSKIKILQGTISHVIFQFLQDYFSLSHLNIQSVWS